MVLQCICDAHLKFTDCFCGHPGSVHDARLLRNSPLHSQVQAQPSVYFPHNTQILGDPAYPLESWLLVAYKDNGHLSAQQRRYNTKLSMTHSVIERAVALLKGRFRRLKMLDMNRTDLIPKTVMACCTLHNFCLQVERADSVDDFIQEGHEGAGVSEVTECSDQTRSAIVK